MNINPLIPPPPIPAIRKITANIEAIKARGKQVPENLIQAKAGYEEAAPILREEGEEIF